MTTPPKPTLKPNCPNFSSGPCAKRPGWSSAHIAQALLGRSHRSAPGKKALKDLIEKQRALLGIPDDYKIGIVAGSDTGAVEMALWSLLGERGVDCLAWDNFSKDWLIDIRDQLKIEDLRAFEADYGEIPNLSDVDTDRDVVFAWNGTTAGVCVPNGDWIKSDRKGLTICDATSAALAYDMPWDKLDVTTWSWQKVFGGEAAHGMIVLSPRAVERLENYTPPRPLPKIFRMTKGGKLNEGIFEGLTINTPSLMAVHDCHDAIDWFNANGGKDAVVKRTQDNLETVEKWVEASDWADFLAKDKSIRSRTSICISIKDPWFNDLPQDKKMPFVKSVVKMLDEENVARDFASYKTAPAGFRIWGGSTVETSDIDAMLPWLDWAYASQKDTYSN